MYLETYFAVVYSITKTTYGKQHLNGLVQERRNSITNALELRLSCTNHLVVLSLQNLNHPIAPAILAQNRKKYQMIGPQ